MKRLILMRHAKSSWNDPLQPDHERPLNGRGRRSAKAIGAWLADQGYVPDEVISSDAARTQETYALMGLQGCSPHWHRALYLASAATMMKHLRAAQGDTVLMLGHNPGIAELAERLLVSPVGDGNFQRFPTAATLIARFDVDAWRDIDWGSAQAEAFTVPRTLGIA